MLSYRNRHKAHLRAKRFERALADQGVASLSKEARLARAREEEREHQALMTATKRARKLGKQIRKLEERIPDLRESCKQFEDAYVVAYERHMPIRLNNQAFLKTIARAHLTREEVMLIVNHPEAFPNPELVYNMFSNSYYVTWEGK